MRILVTAALAVLALTFAVPAVGQDASAPAGAGLPKGPVPYTQLHPKKPAAKPRAVIARPGVRSP